MEVEIKDQPNVFISQIETEFQQRVFKVIDFLEEWGSMLRMPYSKNIGKNIFELRIIGKHNVRLIYTFKFNKAIIFYGFYKKTERISIRDLHEIERRHSIL